MPGTETASRGALNSASARVNLFSIVHGSPDPEVDIHRGSGIAMRGKRISAYQGDKINILV